MTPTRYRVAEVMAAAADGATGRRSALSVETIAQRAGTTNRTVRRTRSWLSRAGLAVEVFRGRHLTAAERQARREVGGRGITASSVWALTHPASAYPHPVRGSGSSKVSHGSQRAAARRGKGSRTVNRDGATRQPRSRALWRLTAATAREVRGLDNGARHLGALADGLARAGAEAWDVADVLDALAADGRTCDVEGARDRVAYVVGRVRRAVAAGFRPRAERVAASVAEREARQVRQRAEREAERAGRASAKVAAVALASIRATLAGHGAAAVAA